MSISKIKIDSTTHDIVAGGITYCTCSTAAATAAKVATVVSGSFTLFTGAVVVVKFTNENSVASPTLNVASTGAKPIVCYGTTAASTGTTTTGWVAGAIQMFVYDGTSWVRDYWSNTTYSNVALGQGYATCSTAAATAAKVGTLSSYSLTTGGIVSVKFTYDVPASATLNINSKGAKSIYYKGAAITAGIIKAGDVATFIYSSQYHLISIDRGFTNFVKSGSTAAAGLVPAPPTTAGTTKYLREDGTWQVPPDTNTTYTLSSITGTLPISKGGTGATTDRAAEAAINGNIPETTEAIGDTFKIVFKRSTPDATNGAFLYRQASLFWTYIKGKADSVYAKSSHGNHVPTTETANNAKFLRNDNTWQTVTPANIGAAASSHTHSGYAPAYQYSTTDLTAGSSSLTTGTLYFVYE